MHARLKLMYDRAGTCGSSEALLHGPVFPEKWPLKWCNTSARPNPAYYFFWGWGGLGEVNKRSTWRPYPHFSRRLPLPRNNTSAQKDAAGTLISLDSDFRNRGLSGCPDCELDFAHHRSLSEKQTKDQIICLNAVGRPEIPNVLGISKLIPKMHDTSGWSAIIHTEIYLVPPTVTALKIFIERHI
jgi:hypothetical protein